MRSSWGGGVVNKNITSDHKEGSEGGQNLILEQHLREFSVFTRKLVMKDNFTFDFLLDHPLFQKGLIQIL